MHISKKGIKTKLLDYIYQNTGISLSAREIKIRKRRKALVVEVYGVRFGETDLRLRELKGCSVEDIAILIIERAGDIKQAMVEAKIGQLKKGLPLLEAEIKTRLSLRLNQELLDNLSFVIEDRGYDYTHYKADQEAEAGFPLILLHIFNHNGLRVDCPLNICFPQAPVEEMDLLLEKIVSGSRAAH